MRIIVLFLLTIILLTGCDEKAKTTHQQSTMLNTDILTEEKTTDTSKDSEDVYPDETKMSKDIDSIGGNVITFDERQSYTLTTSTVTIDKASKNKENFTVYCTAKQESKDFTAANKYILTYNFYEIGGWILDDCTLDEINMTPISMCPEWLATQALHESFGFTHSEFIKSEKNGENDYSMFYNGYIECAYADEIYECAVRCCYDNAWGWACYPDVEDIDYDFSRIYGNWYGEDSTYSNQENNEKKCWLNIQSVDMKSGIIMVTIEILKGTLHVEPIEIMGYIEENDQKEVDNYGKPYFRAEVALPLEILGQFDSNMVYVQFDQNYGVKAIEYSGDWMAAVKVN